MENIPQTNDLEKFKTYSRVLTGNLKIWEVSTGTLEIDTNKYPLTPEEITNITIGNNNESST